MSQTKRKSDSSGADAKGNERQSRLAAALRANLKKRKAQTRSRKESGTQEQGNED
ncbi:hypothetical protein ACFOW6_05715 [Fodinicurvata halophila]|uniref:Small EDRK-rich factor-like N-terminal domain-containing protein n=1 Tax=Fodinicurvata halophila TaxID=1419723 RepID=A0ABV8UID7_9PROT